MPTKVTLSAEEAKLVALARQIRSPVAVPAATKTKKPAAKKPAAKKPAAKKPATKKPATKKAAKKPAKKPAKK